MSRPSLNPAYVAEASVQPRTQALLERRKEPGYEVG